jgi:hypothetical protein
MKTIGNYDFVVACFVAQDRPEGKTLAQRVKLYYDRAKLKRFANRLTKGVDR